MRIEDILFNLTFWYVPFGARQVGVARHAAKGLFVMDPIKRGWVATDSVRLYSTKSNKLVVIGTQYFGELSRPLSEPQVQLAVAGYKSFLHPSAPRPAALDKPQMPKIKYYPPGPIETDEHVGVNDGCWELCSSCGGNGGEYDMFDPERWVTCERCAGTGHVR